MASPLVDFLTNEPKPSTFEEFFGGDRFDDEDAAAGASIKLRELAGSSSRQAARKAFEDIWGRVEQTNVELRRLHAQYPRSLFDSPEKARLREREASLRSWYERDPAAAGEVGQEEIDQAFKQFARVFPYADRQEFERQYQEELKRSQPVELLRAHVERHKANRHWIETDKFFERLPFAGSVGVIKHVREGNAALEAVHAGKATPSDYEAAGKALARLEIAQEMGFGDKVMELVKDLPAFAIEFMATAGAGSAGKAGLQRAGLALLGQAGRRGGYAAVKAGGIAGAAGLQTLANPQRIAATAVQRMADDYALVDDEKTGLARLLRSEGEELGTALPNALLDTFIEMGSERLGGPVVNLLAKAPGAAKAQALKAAIASRWLSGGTGRTVSEFSKHLSDVGGWNGVLGEMLEERLGEEARFLTRLEDQTTLRRALAGRADAFEDLGAEFLAFMVPGAALKGAGLAEGAIRGRSADQGRSPSPIPKVGPEPVEQPQSLPADQLGVAPPAPPAPMPPPPVQQPPVAAPAPVAPPAPPAPMPPPPVQQPPSTEPPPVAAPAPVKPVKPTPAPVAPPAPTPAPDTSPQPPAGPAAEPSPQPALPSSSRVALADRLKQSLDAGEQIDGKRLFEIADEVHGGTRGQGKYLDNDAYDSLELAVSRHLQGKTKLDVDEAGAKEEVARLGQLLDKLPTQRIRSGEKETHQQFSTPPTYAYAAAWLAGIKPGEVALEPSAGTGHLAIQMQNAGAKVYVNEYSENRLELLNQLGFEKVFRENAEQAANILAGKMPRPNVVVMNPPFSATAGRMGDKKVLATGAIHVEQALKLLAPGGRLVAIVGRGMDSTSARFRDWWSKIKKEYRVRANVGVSGDVYKKYGTHFGTRVLVFDKAAPIPGAGPITGSVDSLDQLIDLLGGIRNDRAATGKAGAEPALPQSPVQDPPSAPRPGGEAGPTLQSPTPPVGNNRVPPEGGVGQGGAQRPGGGPAGGESPGTAGPGPALGTEPGRPSGNAGGDGPNVGPVGGRESTHGGLETPRPVPEPRNQPADGPGAGGVQESERVGRVLDAYRNGHPRDWTQEMANELTANLAKEEIQAIAQALDLATVKSRADVRRLFEVRMESWNRIQFREPTAKPAPAERQAKEETGDTFESYQTSFDTGAPKHGIALVESAAQAAVDAPPVTYQHHLPASLIKGGKLSDAQMEQIVRAGQAHEVMLDSGERQGYLVGDGTGVGKSRIAAGIILDNFAQGRKRALWISKNSDLYTGTRKEWKELSGTEDNFLSANKLGYGELKVKEGVVYMGYDTLKSAEQKKLDQPDEKTGKKSARGKTRIQQIVDWLGADFDGVIIFDEAHSMANALEGEGTRGKKEASQRGLAGTELQKLLPKARVVYATATAATEVRNLAYASRLGLWGKGTPFPSVNQFIDKIKTGGVAVMEMVAQSIKAMGLGLARSISYRGVEFDRLTHKLTPEQRATYDNIAEAWQVIFRNFNAAFKLTDISGKDKGQIMGQFWGFQLRFFNTVVTGMSVPSVIADMEKQLAAGHAAVLHLVDTGEAAQERAAAKAAAEGLDIEEMDLSPKETLMQWVENAFPVEQYEEYQDENGNVQRRMVTDSNGNPVINREALAMRDALLEKLGAYSMPESALDQIVNHFGPQKVAEITGRKRRRVRKLQDDGTYKLDWEKRPDRARAADVDAFMNDKKQILIFSKKGGTGASYHADLRTANQRLRVHYALQNGWQADEAVQFLGRTHRSNQKQPPRFVLVETELEGHKRFISTIARRLEQLGALTKGQRQTGSTGLFSAADNLESTEAKDALRTFLKRLASHQVTGLDVTEFETMTGLKLRDAEGHVLETMPPISQFLNRLLAMPIEKQNAYFRGFSAIHRDIVATAVRNGTLDVGVENYKAQKLDQAERRVVYQHRSGADASYYRLLATKKNEPITWDEIKGFHDLEGFVRNERSGKVWAVQPLPDKTDPRTGRVYSRVRLVGISSMQDAERQDVEQGEGWKKLKEGEARKLWDAQVESVPDTHQEELHVISGALFPIWDRLTGPDKIWRFQTNAGTIAGRIVPKDDIKKVLKSLGADFKASELDLESALADLMSGDYYARLANNWTIRRVMVSGEYRLELKTPDAGGLAPFLDELKKDGAIVNRIEYKTRVFIPTGDQARPVLERIIKSRPITDLIEMKGGGDVQHAGGVEAYRDRDAAGGVLEPVAAEQQRGPAAAFAFEPAETPDGQELLSKLQADMNQKGLKKIGPRSIVEFLIDLVNARLLVGRSQTSKRNPAHYQRSTHIIRSRVGHWQINFHEMGHALSGLLRDRDAGWIRSLGGKSLIELTNMPGFASAHTPEEGVAELVRRYVVDYGSIPAGLRTRFEDKLEAVEPEILAGLRDAHRAYQLHKRRPMADQLEAMMQDHAPKKGLGQGIIDLGYWALYNLVGGTTVTHRLYRQFFKGITGGGGSIRYLLDKGFRSQVKLARSFFDRVKDSPADLDSAYNTSLHAAQEAQRALYGVKGNEGIRIWSIGNGFGELDPIDVAQLRKAGFEIPHASTRHGEWIELHPESYAAIKADVGEADWNRFELYGQYRTALVRYQNLGHAYPGMHDGLTPAKLKQFVADQEKAHPEWKTLYSRVNRFMNQLLLVPVLSGELGVSEALAIMKTHGGDYWPLLRQVEDRSTSWSSSARSPSSGVRRAHGSELPFEPLDSAMEFRVRLAYEAYAQLGIVKALRAFGDELDRDKQLPFEVRKAGKQLLLPLRMDIKKVARLTAEEEARVIADHLNQQMADKTGKKVDDLPDDLLVSPEDIDVRTAGHPVWRTTKPSAVRVIKSFEHGQPVYLQVPDAWLFDFLANQSKPHAFVSWVSGLMQGIQAPWKRALTQNVPFALGNFIGRDPGTAAAMGRNWKSLLPFYYATLGVMSRLKGGLGNRMSESELFSKALDITSRKQHQSAVDSFVAMLKEGLVVENAGELSGLDWIQKAPGIAMSAVLKPIDVLNWITGGRYLSNLGEKVTREGAAYEAIQAGESPQRAQVAYDRITGHFQQRQGSADMAAIVKSAGFLNPGIQILWGLASRITDPDPTVRVQTGAGVLFLKMPAMAALSGMAAAMNILLIYLLHPDDDEREKVFNDMRERPDNERLGYRAVGGKVRIPFDYGLVGAAQSFGWNTVEGWLLGGNSKVKAEAYLKRMSSVPGFGDFIPPHVKTMLELQANYSWFWEEAIVPAWLESRNPNAPEQQTLPDTPEFYNAIGRALGVSPLKARYAVRNLFTSQMDELIRAMGDKRPIDQPAALPVVGRTFVREPLGHGAQSIRDLDSLDEEYNRLIKEGKAALARGETGQADEIRKKLGILQDAHAMMNRLERLTREVNKERSKAEPNWDMIRNQQRDLVHQAREFLKQRKN